MNTKDRPQPTAAIDERIQSAALALASNTSHLFVVAEYPTLRLIHINPAGRKLLGLESNADLTRSLWANLVSAGSLKVLVDEGMPTAIREGVWRGDARLKRSDGSECAVTLMAAGIAARNGEGTSILFAATDRSTNEQVKASLEQEQVLLHAMLDYVPDSIYFKDLKSRFLRVSSFQARKKGANQPEDLVGKTDFDFFSDEHAKQALDDEQRIIRTGQPMIDMEEKETWPDGRVTWVSTSKMPLRDANGRTIGTFGISRDITARKETEQKLQVAQKELLEASRLAGMAEIASGVLHNIGNALNSVNTSVALTADQLARSRLGNLSKVAELLKQNAANLGTFLTQDERGKQLPGYVIQLAGILASERETFQSEIEQLRRSLEHIKDIVAMQQNYARVSGVVEDASPVELIEEALQISAMSLSRHGIAVQRDFYDVPSVRVSRHKVLQILVNLIRNAKYAMDETGRTDKEMTIALRATPAGRVQIIVRDNGVGIPEENLTKIFQFGFTTRKQGHGFGLHSSANAAKELGGTLHAESKGRGDGATFVLELPAAPAREAATVAHAAA